MPGKHLGSLLAFILLAGCGDEAASPHPGQTATSAPAPGSGATPHPSARIDMGRLKYAGICLGCHGKDGQGQGPFPRLAGRPAPELAALLKDYRAGRVRSPQSDIMKPFADPLTDAEIEALAGYLSRL